MLCANARRGRAGDVATDLATSPPAVWHSVTTSCVDGQAYKEIKEDEHPILVIAASDIVGLLKQTGYGTVGAVQSWLERSFPSSL